ncbi:MAG: hypothetical protein K2X47_03850, partial [Bdellovibrionales bacterium]|nr:hypothetical protein [Bdellovibrionales bacterium]
MKTNRKISALVLILFTSVVVGCSREGKISPNALGLSELTDLVGRSVTSAEAEKLWWIDRVSRRLRYQQGLIAGDPVQDWLSKTDEEIVDLLMADPRFSYTVMDFHLGFLGRHIDRIGSTENVLNPDVFRYPQMLSAVRGVMGVSAYEQFFSYRQPLYVPMLTAPAAMTPEDRKLTPKELRNKRSRDIQNRFSILIRDLEAGGATADTTAACGRAGQIFNRMGNLGLPIEFSQKLSLSPNWFLPVTAACTEKKSADVVIAGLKKAASQTQKLFDQWHQFEPEVYHPRFPHEVQSLQADLGEVHDVVFDKDLKTQLTNSSTNYNRKRGAYILARYFCDDLTPINVVDDGRPGSGKHGTQQSCQACHFKLDPMAGFFRNLGRGMMDFSGSSEIIFDDAAKKPLTEYFDASNWKAEAKTGRTWEVGYVRSLQFPQRNQYGESLEDLFEIIRDSSEVRSCLVKKMYEYFVGHPQLVEAGYLESLEKAFSGPQGVAKGFKAVAKAVLLGRAVREQDPEPDQCYDFGDRFNPKTSPPCVVSGTLHKNCASCHGPATQMAGLDV